MFVAINVYLFYVVAMFAGAYDGFGLACQYAGRGFAGRVTSFLLK